MGDNKKEVKIIRPQKGFQERFVSSNVDFVVGGAAMGVGKAQPLHSLVCTPFGFRKLGELKIGDIVSGSDGGTQYVERIFERGMLDSFEITFDDDTKVECCPEHLWTVWDNVLKSYITLEASEIAEDTSRYEIPLAKKIKVNKDFKNSLSDVDKVRCNGYKAVKTESGIKRSKGRKKIVSIKGKGKQMMRCIVVSNPDHLYITDGFTLTHNSFAALLIAADQAYDPNFRMVYIRRNIGDLKAGGAGIDEATKIYGNIATIKVSENPRLTFPSGSFIDFTHMSDQTEDKVLERIRGWQYSCVYIDEGTGFEWSTVRLIFSRNRSSSNWSGKIRITCNPKKSHWLRKWLAWYIDPFTGYPIPERDGVVRYFFIRGDRIEDVVFGDSAEEVYEKCRTQIDAILSKMNQDGHEYSYKNIVKTTTFYSGKLSDNHELLKNNPGYMGSIAAMGGKQADANLLGCWNVDPESDENNPIPYSTAATVFDNDPCVNNDRWITADLADTGTDNTVILVWNGTHVIDIKILCTSTPRENAQEIIKKAVQYNVADTHIIYDGVRAAYMKDYIEDAIPFKSYSTPIGKYARTAFNLKDECYLRLASMIRRGMISFDKGVAQTQYKHQRLKQYLEVQTEFCEECSVVQFKEVQNGKLRLLNKKDMNQELGNNRSMDLLDPCAMRMLPFLPFEYGSELMETEKMYREEEETVKSGVNIYSESTWA